MKKLLDFLNELDGCKANYRVEHHRPDSIMVIVRVPYAFWEVEFFEDNHIEIEVLRSKGDIEDEGLLEELLRQLRADYTGTSDQNK